MKGFLISVTEGNNTCTVTLFGNDTEGVMNYRGTVSPNRSHNGPADLFTTSVQLPNVFLLIFNKQAFLLGFYMQPSAVFLFI